VILQFIGLTLLILLAGFFSSTETALFSFSRSQLLHFRKSKNPQLRLAASLMDNPNHVLVSLLIGNNMVNIMFVLILNHIIQPFSDSVVLFQKYYFIRFIFEVGFITSLILLMGEIIPKSIALRFPKQVVTLFVIPFDIFHLVIGVLKIRNMITYGVSFVLNGVAKIYTKKDEMADFSDMQHAVEAAHKKGHISYTEASILDKILDLKQSYVEDFMIDKSQVFEVEPNYTLQKAILHAVQHDVRQCPVYDKKTDTVVGVFDLLSTIHHTHSEFVSDIMETPEFIPQLQAAEKLTEYFLDNKPFYFIVLDEFGQYRGIVNSDGFLNQLTQSAVPVLAGELPAGIESSKIGYKVNADVKVDVVESLLNANFKSKDAQSIAGVILEAIGRIPKEKEWVVIEGWKFYIEKSEPNRIIELQILKRRVI
jgi:putative hemolysin